MIPVDPVMVPGGSGGIEGLNPLSGGGLNPLSGGQGAGAPKLPDGITPFKDLLASSIQRVNEMQLAAEKAKTDFVVGGPENFGEALVSMRKADLAFQQLLEIRNKLVDAYQEVMRMQI